LQHDVSTLPKPHVNILLVDDNPANLLALRAILEDLGENLVEVRSGEEAFERLQGDEYAVVLLDVHMPGLDGFETAKLIRQQGRTRHTPIIFLTAHDIDRAQIERGYLLGAVDFLVKPLVPVILRAKVSGFVEIYEAKQRTMGYLRDLAEKTRQERHRNTRLAVTQVLTQSASVSEAGAGILQAVCQNLGWDVGLFWTLNAARDVLQFLTSWRQANVSAGDFEVDSRTRVFRRGEGLPGRVWQRGKPAWVLDVVLDTNFPRAASAAKGGLHGAFACPIVVGADALGVIEFFSHEIRPPDADALELMDSIAGQIGQFIERKTAEDQLRRSEQELSDFFENATIGLHWVGPDGVILRVNKAELDLLGYRADEYVGRNIVDFHVDQAVIGDILRRLRQGEKLVDMPAQMVCKDGSIRDVLIDSSVMWKDGEFIHTRCFTRDVTEQKRSQEALEASEQRFGRFMQHLPGLAWIKDAEGRYIYTNDAAEKAFRLPRAKLYGKTDWEIFDAATAARFRDNDGKALASETGVLVIETLADEHGVVHHSLVSKFPIFGPDGQAALIGGMAIDISDRRQAEEQLLRNKQRLELAQTAGRIGTFEWNIQTNDVEWSATEEDLFVLPAVGFGGKFDDWKESVHPADRDRALADAQRAVAQRGDLSMEYRIIRPDGEVRWMAAHGRVYCDEEGSAQRMIGVNIDVTERKEADRRKDEFLATLAHELRNPLAPIRNSLHILKMPKLDEAVAQKTREMMERQVHQLVRLVDDLLDVSRVMRGKVELRRQTVALADVIGRAVETARPLFDSHGHELTIDLPTEPLFLCADPVRLAQVVGNLLTNAAKYTEAKGRIRLAAQRDGPQVRLHVRDTGIGIAPEILPRIFELFVQADHASDRAQGGLGVGLTLVKSLVEMHSGSIEAKSEGLGKGSEFIVRLPVVDEAPHVAPDNDEQTPSLAQKASGHRILVVDDNQDAADSLAMLLRMQGHHVRVANNGFDALEAVNVERPDIVFLDIGMPKMDGYEVARRLRLQPGANHLVLAALTGWGQKEDRRKSEEAGFDYHLVKPLEPKALEQVLAELKK
jgi:PAS domain S-box-containing protein